MHVGYRVCIRLALRRFLGHLQKRSSDFEVKGCIVNQLNTTDRIQWFLSRYRILYGLLILLLLKSLSIMKI